LTLAIAIAAIAQASSALAQGGADTSLVRIGPGAGTAAFVTWPPGDKPIPAVVMIHEAWGMNGQVRRQARNLARQGYLVIVPDLYRGQVTNDPEHAEALERGLDADRAMADLAAAVAWVRANGRTKGQPVGVVGFGMGGSLAERVALGTPGLAGAVLFYGDPITDARQLAALQTPLLGHFGADDRGIPAERAEAMRAALREAKKQGDVYVYAGAGHAFMNETRDSFHPDAARLAWARTLAFFQRTLKGQGD
jgi:carboxymethylenebutenolidase